MAGDYVMQVYGLADGSWEPPGPCFIQSRDVNAPEGEDVCVLTSFVAQAERFATHTEAVEAWREIREIDPIRADGKPNRPLTMFTVMIHTAADAHT